LSLVASPANSTRPCGAASTPAATAAAAGHVPSCQPLSFGKNTMPVILWRLSQNALLDTPHTAQQQTPTNLAVTKGHMTDWAAAAATTRTCDVFGVASSIVGVSTKSQGVTPPACHVCLNRGRQGAAAVAVCAREHLQAQPYIHTRTHIPSFQHPTGT
jgi:hypothetical protein